MKATNDFYDKVYELVRRIPYGRITTYGAIAKAAGLASSARMVGWALNAAKYDESLPCHRVVNRMGELSGKRYFATPELMRELLEAEGIGFNGDTADIEKHFWDPNE